MKKNRLISAVIIILLSSTMLVRAQVAVQQLPPAITTGGQPLMQVLSERQSGKNFSANNIEAQTLSEILWAAWGINRSDGNRTIPTAMNAQNMQLYVIKADGAWLYNAQAQALNQIYQQDIRTYFTTQYYTENAPLFLVYAINEGIADITAGMQAGSMYQNVALYCASKGLNNVVRSYFDKASVAGVLGIEEGSIVISQVVGWPEFES